MCVILIVLFSSQAVNDIIFGGDLVTTVCHSTPFVVDTTPPSLDRVRDVLFDDDFHFLVIYFNAFDTVSGISRVEFGLGSTKYDVMVRRYIQYEIRGVAGNNYITDEDFEMNLGIPAYIRLKVTNTGLNKTLGNYFNTVSLLYFDELLLNLFI